MACALLRAPSSLVPGRKRMDRRTMAVLAQPNGLRLLPAAAVTAPLTSGREAGLDDQERTPSIPIDGSPNPSSAHESARFIASVSLSLGALMLSLFGIIERMVSFEKLAVVNEFALLALLPGIATLAFLACARAISWMISNMRFSQWHGVVPQRRWEETRRLLEEGNQFRFRITLMAGAYLLFALVITALAATSAGLAFGLSAPELGVGTLPLALLGGGVTALLVLYELLTRDGPIKTTLTGGFVAALVVILILDVLL
jgi:hypothetical protein